MRILAAMTITLAMAAGSQGAGKIQVCVNSSTYASAFVLARAEGISSRMFASAGVDIEWHSVGFAVCRNSQQVSAVILDFATNTPPGRRPDAMAYALPYEAVHVVVLYDRIANSGQEPSQVSTLLAHVMTHEITHILQGISRHSGAGIMKAHWDAHDISQMAHTPLPFAQEDIDLMQRGLRLRAADATFALSAGKEK